MYQSRLYSLGVRVWIASWNEIRRICVILFILNLFPLLSTLLVVTEFFMARFLNNKPLKIWALLGKYNGCHQEDRYFPSYYYRTAAYPLFKLRSIFLITVNKASIFLFKFNSTQEMRKSVRNYFILLLLHAVNKNFWDSTISCSGPSVLILWHYIVHSDKCFSRDTRQYRTR